LPDVVVHRPVERESFYTVAALAAKLAISERTARDHYSAASDIAEKLLELGNEKREETS
jgi:hypothetical protein